MAMNEDQFEREKLYQATMNMFQGMLKAGVITEEQYAIIDTKCSKSTGHYWVHYSQKTLAMCPL